MSIELIREVTNYKSIKIATETAAAVLETENEKFTLKIAEDQNEQTFIVTGDMTAAKALSALYRALAESLEQFALGDDLLSAKTAVVAPRQRARRSDAGKPRLGAEVPTRPVPVPVGAEY